MNMFTFALANSVLFLYIAVPLYLIFLTILIEGTNSTGLATLSLGIILVGLQLFTDIHPFTFALYNPLTTLAYAVGYLVIGVIYVYFKWKSYTRMARRAMEAWLENHKLQAPTDAARSLGYISVPLRVNTYKYKITSWMAYWPVSMAWTLLNDPLRRLFESVYYRISSYLQTISNREFADMVSKYNIPKDE